MKTEAIENQKRGPRDSTEFSSHSSVVVSIPQTVRWLYRRHRAILRDCRLLWNAFVLEVILKNTMLDFCRRTEIKHQSHLDRR